MENKLKEAFGTVTMPESCCAKIEEKLCKPKTRKFYSAEPMAPSQFGWAKALAAGAAVLVLVAAGVILQRGFELSSSEAAAATDSATEESSETLEQYREDQERLKDELEQEQERCREMLESTEDTAEDELDAVYAAALEDIKDGLTYSVGKIIYRYSGWDSNNSDSEIRYDTNLHTPWTEVVDGRVIFRAYGVTMDITDQFSQEEPFTYIYTDSHYITHYIAIGGTVDNPGYLEMCKVCWETDMHEGNLGGFNGNTWNNETESYYGWEARAKEIFKPYGVYWVS